MVLSLSGTYLPYFDRADIAGRAYAVTNGEESEAGLAGSSSSAAQETSSTPEETTTTPAEQAEQEKQAQPEKTPADEETSAEPDDSKEDNTAEEPAAPKQRDIEVEAVRDPLYENRDGRKEETEGLFEALDFWYALTGREAALKKKSDDDPISVTVSGVLPEDVKAEATYIEFDEDSKYDETALFALELKLTSADGKPYIPEEPLTVRVKGSRISEAVGDDDSMLVYSYEFNQDRAKEYKSKYGAELKKKGRSGVYAADVLVYRYDSKAAEGTIAGSSYNIYDEDEKYKDGEDAVRYTEDGNGLALTSGKELEFEYPYGTSLDSEAEGDDARRDVARFVLSALKHEKPEADKTEEDNKKTDEKTEEKTSEDEKDKETPEEEKSVGGTLTATDGKTYKVTVSYGEDAGLPEGLELDVKVIGKKSSDYSDYVDKAAGALDTTKEELRFAHVFDITLVDPKTGKHYQPDSKVNVSIDLLKEDVENRGEVGVVHFREGLLNKLGVGNGTPEVMDSEVTDGAVEFESSAFSVYVVVQNTKEMVLTASDGKKYKITVTYNSRSGIPDDAELVVSELDKDSSDYDAYVDQTAKALGRRVKQLGDPRAFDIKLVDPASGETYQPTENVKVSVRLLDEEVKAGDGKTVVHFKGSESEPEVLENNITGDGAIEFETGSFSVYVISQDALAMRFVFLNGNNTSSDVFSEQKLANGEDLVEAPKPTKSGTVFQHWSDTPNGNPYDFENNTTYNPVKIKDSDVPGADFDAKQAYLDEHPVYFYAVYGDQKCTVTFYNQSGLIVQREEAVIGNGERINTTLPKYRYIPIQDKEGANLAFKYWTRNPNGVGENAGTIDIDEEGKEEIKLYPVLVEGHSIYFDSNRSSIGKSKATYVPPLFVENQNYTAADKVAAAGTYITGIINDTDPEKPTYREEHCIPTADGYTFDGWYVTPGCTGNPVFTAVDSDNDGKPDRLGYNRAGLAGILNSNANLPNNPTLYAKWNANTTANYTVVFWEQSIDDDKDAGNPQKTYDFVSSEVRNGTVGNTVSATPADIGKQITGFQYNDANSETSKTLKADGSTVLNIRYDRKKYTFKFTTYYYYGSQVYQDSNGYWRNLNTGNRIYSNPNSQTVETMSGLYGQPLSKYSYEWPKNFQWKERGSYTSLVGATNEFNQNIDAICYLRTGPAKLDYFLEKVDGSWPATTDLHSGYQSTTTVSYGYVKQELFDGYEPVQYRFLSEGNSWKDISESYTTDKPIGDGLEIRHARKSYDLRFREYDPETDRETAVAGTTDKKVKYGVALDSYLISPTKEGYTFGGWYLDKTCSDEAAVPATATMPKKTLTIYAKWVIKEYPVILDFNYGQNDSAQASTFNVKTGETISLGVDPTRDYVKVDNDTGEYDYNEDTHTYELNPTNQGDYAYRSGAYVFLGWYEPVIKNKRPDGKPADPDDPYITDEHGDYPRDENGEIITESNLFDFKVAPDHKVYLVAKWQRAGGFFVRYDIHDPDLPANTSYETIQVPKDQEEYIEGAHAIVLPSLGAPKGYTLDYWYNTKNASRHYQPNELVHVTDAMSVQDGNSMVLKLTAHYKPYNPADRIMADYTFMTSVENDPGNPGHTRFITDSTGKQQFTNTYEIQKISVNETLRPPVTMKAPDGYVFKGWYYDTQGTRKFEGFGVVANPVYTTLYAIYESVHTVTYYLTDASTNKATRTVLSTQTYDPGQNLDTRHVIHPVDSDHYVKEWRAGSWSTNPVTGRDEWNDANPPVSYSYNTYTSQTVSSDISLRAVILERKFVEFNTNGSDTYIDPQEITHTDWPVRPETIPVRAGYIFDGWYTLPTGGVQYNFDKPLSNVSEYNGKALYAHWTPDGTTTGSFTVVWWAQTSDRPEDTDAGYPDDPDYDINTDTQHYQLIASEQMQAPLGTYSKADYGKSTSQGGLGLFTGWNALNTVLTRANGAGNPVTQAFIRNTLGLSESTPITADHITQMMRYYEYKSNYGSAVDSSITVDDKGNTVLNVRFVLKLYDFKYNATNGSFKVKIHAGGRSYTESQYSYKAWLGKDISKNWPIMKKERADAPGDSKGAWVERISGTAEYSGWKEVDGTGSMGTLQPTANRGKIDIAANYNDTYSLKVTTTTNTTPGFLHYMEWNGENYVEMEELGEEKQLYSYGYNPAPSGCSMTYYDYMYAKDISNYVHVSDKDGEPRPAREHNYYHNSYYAHWVKREGTITQDKYVNVYKNSRNTEYDDITFYTTRRWLIFAYDYGDPITRVDFNEDEDLNGKYATDGTSLNGYSRTENNMTFYSYNRTVENKTVYYQKGGQWLSMSWSEFVSKVYPSTQKTYHYTETITGATGYDLYFYYEPQTFIVTLMDRGDKVKQLSVKYKAQLLGPNGALNPYDPSTYTPPKAAPEGKEFKGWAIIDGQSDPSAAYSSSDGKMPPYNLTLYAIWADKRLTVITDGVDEEGNANDGAETAEYSVAYNKKLKETPVPKTPKRDGEIFKGWQLIKEDGRTVPAKDISMNYAVKKNITIKPVWQDLNGRKITYHANGGTDGSNKDEDKYIVDGNLYIPGARATIKSGDSLYIMRTDIEGKSYKGTFAYWNTRADGKGETYLPNTGYEFPEGGEDLELYAIYGQYRETILSYDKNAPDSEAKFVLQGEETKPYDQMTPYTNKLDPQDKRVKVLFRDEKSEGWNDSWQFRVNERFIIGTDEDIRKTPEKSKFTVVRRQVLSAAGEEEMINNYVFAGWAESNDPSTVEGSIVLAKNGDKAYVNTIREEDRNVLYAVWGICKIVTKEKDKWGFTHTRERVFPTIQSAVEFVAGDPKDARNESIFKLNDDGNRQATIQMLVDYYHPSTDAVEIHDGLDITLTTARRTSLLDLITDLYYKGSNPTAVIKRAGNYKSMFTVENGGRLSLGEITLDGYKVDGNNNARFHSTTDGGLVNVNAGGALTIGTGNLLRNSTVGSGVNGPAIYLDDGSNLYISGEPKFGEGNLANTVTKDGYSDKMNGSEPYTGNIVRQDIFLTETGSGDPTCIVVTGDITSGEGNIWLWAEANANRYEQLMPFARLQNGTKYNGLDAFRNAQDDATTKNATSSYLRGSAEGEKDYLVYWSGVKGSREVILRKVVSTNGGKAPLSGKTFSVYRGSSETALLSDLSSNASGVFHIGEMTYGIYLVEESTPHEWFWFIVDDKGVTYSDGGYETRNAAYTDATNRYANHGN